MRLKYLEISILNRRSGVGFLRIVDQQSIDGSGKNCTTEHLLQMHVHCISGTLSV